MQLQSTVFLLEMQVVRMGAVYFFRDLGTISTISAGKINSAHIKYILSLESAAFRELRQAQCTCLKFIVAHVFNDTKRLPINDNHSMLTT